MQVKTLLVGISRELGYDISGIYRAMRASYFGSRGEFLVWYWDAKWRFHTLCRCIPIEVSALRFVQFFGARFMLRL